MVDISERSLEETIERALLAGGPDEIRDGDAAHATAERSPAYGEGVPGGFRRRAPGDYDRERCLIARDVLDLSTRRSPASGSG